MNKFSAKRAALKDMQSSKLNINILLNNMKEIEVLNALLFPVEQKVQKEEVTIEITLPKVTGIPKITKFSYKRSYFVNPDGTISLEEETYWDFK